jgi:hypothetical protein
VKKLLIASVITASIAALSLWGNRLLERTLDAELAPLLTRQLGLPVTLSPLKTQLLQLKGTSANLTMGDPKDPAVVATEVEVTLAWADLLRGEVRLVTASASDLTLRISQWPSSDSPLPDNYRFLDPYLPRSLTVQTGRYVFDDGDAYHVDELHWQRHGSGRATTKWIKKRTEGDIDLAVELTSLPDLLDLAPVEGELTIQVDGKPDSTIKLQVKVQPGTKSAYSAQLDLKAGGMTANTVATGQTAWQFPDQSTSTIPLLEPDRVSALLASYGESDQSTDLATRLAQTLPRLSLPAHQGHVEINEIRINDEINKDTTFEFMSSEQGVQINTLTSNGPAGILTGELSIASSAEGWTFAMAAKLQARETGGAIAAQFTGSDWLLQTGRAKIKGQGDTWGALLNSLQGDASAAGHYHGTVDTPVAFKAQLDKRPGEFALDQMMITLGEGKLSGSAALSGTDQRKLSIDLKGTNLNLDFLFDTDDVQPLPGMALPSYLGVLPELELNVVLDVDGLETPALSLGQAKATLERTAQGGTLVATAKGMEAGDIKLTLEAIAPANQPSTFELKATFNDLDIPDMFRQPGFFYSRSSGSLNFGSKGDGIEEVFTAMRGKAKIAIDVRADNNWQRQPEAGDKLEFTGTSKLVIANDRIVGVEIKNLDIDSVDQDLTGDISVVAGRSPWLVADLESEKLNINSLLALLPESSGKTNADILPSLQRLGAAQASIDVKSLSLYKMPLSDVRIEVVSSPDIITVKQLNFLTKSGALKSQAKISWKDQQATLEGTAELSNVDLDQFLITSKTLEHVPVSGSAKLLSTGSDIEELLSNLTGYVELQSDTRNQDGARTARRKLAMEATRLSDGMQADITSLKWGDTELAGKVRYYQTEPPQLDIDIHSGSISLVPWEDSYLKEEDGKDNKKTKDNSIGSLAKTSANFVGDVLLTPFRMLADDTDSEPGAKLFSSEPLPLDALKKFNMKMSVELDSLVSKVVTVKEINLSGSLENGQLTVKASTDELNKGSGELDLALDTSASPATLKLTSSFENVRGLVDRNTYPRSGFISLDSRGQSEADLAANAGGLVFLQLGQGPFDYANSVLLTTNIASTVFQTLIPGVDRKQPELECGIAVALFKDGKGVTPYGFAMRTNQANLLGHIHIDLGKETIEMSLDSRGREGVGISVGSIFSNTIQIKGPLTDPGIVPDAVGLAWRGWAAVLTGGLSVLGETLVKRVLASENPCKSISKLITKDLCPANPIAASSPLVCPAK